MDDTDFYLDSQLTASEEAVSVTDTSSVEENSSSWFGLSTFSNMAKTIGKNIDGITTVMKSGAQVLLDELAELENEANRSDQDIFESETPSVEIPMLPLPWEICLQSFDRDLDVSIEQKEDAILKDRIFLLSLDRKVFETPYGKRISGDFTLDDARLGLIHRLLEEDQNLHSAYTKISDQCQAQKKLFWQNYFFHCDEEREKRQHELDEECTRKASRDEELDAVIIGTPKSTVFYPSRAKSSSVTPDRTQIKQIQRGMSEDCDDFVIVENSDCVV